MTDNKGTLNFIKRKESTMTDNKGTLNFIIGHPGSGVQFYEKFKVYGDLKKGKRVIVIDPYGGFAHMRTNFSNCLKYFDLSRKFDIVGVTVSENGEIEPGKMQKTLKEIVKDITDGENTALYVYMGEVLFHENAGDVSMKMIDEIREKGIDVTLAIGRVDFLLACENAETWLKDSNEVTILTIPPVDRITISKMLDIPNGVLDKGAAGVTCRTPGSIRQRARLGKGELGEELYQCMIAKPA